MGEAPLRADPSAASLREQILEITQTLESLRERLDRLGGAESGRAVAPGGADAVAPADPHTLHGLEEVLAIPASAFGPAEVFGHAMDRMARLLDADRSMFFVLDPERGHLVPTAARGFRRDDLAGVAIASGEGLIGRAFQEGRVLAYARPAEATPSDAFVARFPVRDAVAVPVRAEGQVLGVLYAGRRGREAPFALDEIRLLLVIADRIATAFTHQQLVERAAGH